MNDREKLIEVYAEAKDKNREICSIFSDCEGCAYEDVTNCHDAIIVDNLIANGVTVQQWIPVTERLPRREENPVLAVWHGTVEMAWHRGNGVFEALPWLTTDIVTHWMPLPEPPEEE